MKESTRAWVYRICTAAVPLLVSYGVIADNKAGLFLGLAGAVLGFGTNLLASVNTSTDAPR
jgi:hypothetical protein